MTAMSDHRQLSCPEIIRIKHGQVREARARIRELEKSLAKVTGERDDWQQMFQLRKLMTDLSLEAVLQQNKINDDLRTENNRLRYKVNHPEPKIAA